MLRTALSRCRHRPPSQGTRVCARRPLSSSALLPSSYAERPTLAAMTVEQKAFYDANGWVKVPKVFSAEAMGSIASWVSDMAGWEEHDSKWMHHYEETEHGARLSRTENFVSYHTEISKLLMAGVLPTLVGDALGEGALPTALESQVV